MVFGSCLSEYLMVYFTEDVFGMPSKIGEICWVSEFQLWFLTAFGMLILNFCFSSSVDTVPNVIPINLFSVSHSEKNPNRLCLFTDTLIPMLFTLLQFHVNNSCFERKNKRMKANKKMDSSFVLSFSINDPFLPRMKITVTISFICFVFWAGEIIYICIKFIYYSFFVISKTYILPLIMTLI